MNGYGSIGIGSLAPISSFDMRLASISASLRGVFYPPSLTTTQRNAITPTYVTNGAIIYNSSTSKFQGYVGTGWTDFN